MLACRTRWGFLVPEGLRTTSAGCAGSSQSSPCALPCPQEASLASAQAPFPPPQGFPIMSQLPAVTALLRPETLSGTPRMSPLIRTLVEGPLWLSLVLEDFPTLPNSSAKLPVL